jgi:exodeoxyribonuclease VII large subunit
LRNGLIARRRQLEGYDKLLGTLSYQSVLQRGFALVRDADGRTVRSASTVQAGDRLDLEFHDGRVEAEALGVSSPGGEKPTLPRSSPQAAPGVRRARGRGGSNQGSLF